MGILAPIFKADRIKKSVDIRKKEIADRRKRHLELLDMEQEYLEWIMKAEINKIDIAYSPKMADQARAIKESTIINKNIEILKKQIPAKQDEVLGVTYKVEVSDDNPHGTPIRVGK
jgi:molybdenum cofactor biosynthesis enzyme